MVRLEGSIVYGPPIHISALQNADVFVHPSITASNGDKEGIPGAIVEAMASGLPVVSTFHAGIPSMINNGENRLLVKENDIEALAIAMARLCNEDGLMKFIGRNAQTYSLSTLDLVLKKRIRRYI